MDVHSLIDRIEVDLTNTSLSPFPCFELVATVRRISETME